MLRKCLFLLAAAACGFGQVKADTVQLKDKAAVTGKILAEKRDQVAVDVGYTVLVIPRNQVSKIVREQDPKLKHAGLETVAEIPETRPGTTDGASQATPAVDPAPKNGFYSVAAKSSPQRTVRDLVSEIGEAVVQVRTPSGMGSGFLLNQEGFLITNFHVIEGETQISIEVYHQSNGQLERRSYKQLRIVAINKFADIALLKVEDREAPRFKFVSIGSADALAVGERVFAIGSPLGLERTVTEGIVSTKTRQMAGELYLQTTTQINPGNSGGPLFNLSGEVVGVTNMKITFGEGLGFAIPIESVRFFLDHRDSFAYSNENPSNAYHYLEPPSRTRRAATDE
jgi:serine protease Do